MKQNFEKKNICNNVVNVLIPKCEINNIVISVSQNDNLFKILTLRVHVQRQGKEPKMAIALCVVDN